VSQPASSLARRALAESTALARGALDTTGRALLDPPSVAPATIRTRFERFELKYRVDEREVRRILAFAAPYLRRDRHAIARDSQRVTSLYLDTRGYRFCEDHLALAPDRSKLRVRVYGHPLGATAFFEVKRKQNAITAKDRFVLPIEEVANVLRWRRLGCSLPSDARRAFANFVFQMGLHRAEPKLFVACFREAYEAKLAGEDVRLTVDRELVYQAARGAGFSVDERRWLPIRDGDDGQPAFGYPRAVLELKFNGSAPAWMVELVRRFDLRREAFSKYTSAALQLRGRL
jgi:hypothetical protein